MYNLTSTRNSLKARRPDSLLKLGLLLAYNVAWNIADDIFSFYEPLFPVRLLEEIEKLDSFEDFQI
jgi:hypothetical protein